MSVEVPISKESLHTYLQVLGKKFRKLNGKKMPAEIILIGGASVLINYGFRDVTYDADAIILSSSVMKEAINFVRDEFALPFDWLNEGVKKTESYSEKLAEVSVYYKSFSNVMTVRTVAAEYLVAMKAMSGRQYKYDLSDIVGILMEHERKNDPISRETIDTAIFKLYGNKQIPVTSQKVLDEVFKQSNYEQFYIEVSEMEKEAKGFLLEFDRDNPGEMKGESINTIIEIMRKRKTMMENNG